MPLRQVWIETGRFGEKLDPAIEQLEIEFLRVDDFRNLLLRLAGDAPRRHHVRRCLQGERLGELRRLGLRELVEQLLFVFDFFVLRLVVVDHLLRRQRVLVVGGIQEDARERVVIARRNRIVFVIVTPRAPHGQSEEAARHDVDAIVAFVGARDFDGAVVVVPRPQAEKSESGQRPRAPLVAEPIARELRLHEVVVRHVVVERLDDPVAIEVRVRIRIVSASFGIQRAVVVFAEARHVEPQAAPRRAVLRRCQQSIHDLRERLR